MFKALWQDVPWSLKLFWFASAAVSLSVPVAVVYLLVKLLEKL